MPTAAPESVDAVQTSAAGVQSMGKIDGKLPGMKAQKDNSATRERAAAVGDAESCDRAAPLTPEKKTAPTVSSDIDPPFGDPKPVMSLPPKEELAEDLHRASMLSSGLGSAGDSAKSTLTSREPGAHSGSPHEPTVADRIAALPKPLPPAAYAGGGTREDSTTLYPTYERGNLVDGDALVPDATNPKENSRIHRSEVVAKKRGTAVDLEPEHKEAETAHAASPGIGLGRALKDVLRPKEINQQAKKEMMSPLDTRKGGAKIRKDDSSNPTKTALLVARLSSFFPLSRLSKSRLVSRFLAAKDEVPFSTYIWAAGFLCYLIGSHAWGTLYAIVACLAVTLYFQAGIERFKAHMEFKGDREAGVRLLQNADGETVEWLNNLVNQIWTTLDPSLLMPVVDIMEDSVASVMPAIVKSCHVQDFELGTLSPRISRIRIYPPDGMDSDVVYGTVHITFHSSSTPQFPESTRPPGVPTPPHLEMQHLLFSKTLTNVVLPIYVGFEGITGTLRFKLKLKGEPPFVKNAAFAFCGLPKLDIGVKVLDRKLPDIIKLPVIHDVVFQRAMNMAFQLFTEPNVIPIDLEKILANDATEHELFARGVLRVTIESAEGLRKADITGQNDCFVSLSLYPRRPIARTRVLINNNHPVWNEVHYIIVSRDDPANHACLRAHIRDWDRLGPSDSLGYAFLPVQEFCAPDENNKDKVENHEDETTASLRGTTGDEDALAQARVVLDETSHLRKGGRSDAEANGTLKWKVEWLPKLSVSFETRMLQNGTRYYSGVLGITIHQCQDLKIGDSHLASRSQLEGVNPYVRVYINDEPAFRTRLKIHNPNPFFNAYTEKFIRDWRKTRVSCVVKDQRHQEYDPVVGVVTVNLADVFEENNVTKEISRWWPLIEGIGYGQMRLTMVFRPVKLELSENERGFEVGTLIVDRLECHGLMKSGNGEDLSTYADIDLNTPVPGKHVTPTAKKASNPSWPQCSFALPVLRRYQTTLLIRLKRRMGLKLKARTIARSELPLNKIEDNAPTELTLPLLPCGNTLRFGGTWHQDDELLRDRVFTNSSPLQGAKVHHDSGSVGTLAEKEMTGPEGEISENSRSKVDDDVRAADTPDAGGSRTPFTSSSVSEVPAVGWFTRPMSAEGPTAVGKEFGSSGYPTVSFRVVFLPGLSAVHKELARDAEEAMEFAAVDASAIADEISETESDGEEIAETAAKEREVAAESESDLNLESSPKSSPEPDTPLAADVALARLSRPIDLTAATITDSTATTGVKPDMLGEEQLDQADLVERRKLHHEKGRPPLRDADAGWRTSSDGPKNKYPGYFGRRAEPMPEVHRKFHRHKFVRTMKWGKEVFKEKVSTIVHGRKDVRFTAVGNIEQEEV